MFQVNYTKEFDRNGLKYLHEYAMVVQSFVKFLEEFMLHCFFYS